MTSRFLSFPFYFLSHSSTNMADENELDAFEQRLSVLESIVFGNAEKDADYRKEEKLKKGCIDGLHDVHSKINTSLASKKKAVLLYQKIPELNSYLDHSYTDKQMLSDAAKADSIISGADLLKKQAALYEVLRENEKHMNSEHIKGVVLQAEKLNTLSKIHITQQDEAATLTEESQKLIEAYNNVVSLMSKQFILWDMTLAKLEKQTKK